MKLHDHNRRHERGSKMGLTRRRLTLAASTFAAALAFGGGLALAQDSVKLGSLHPLSGPLEVQGREAHQGVVVAAERINAAGGIKSMGGAMIEIISEDNGASPEKATIQATRMAGDGVAAFLGTMSSGVALAIQPISERNEIPLVITAAADPLITERDLPYTFRAHADVAMSVDGAIDALKGLSASSGIPIKRVAHFRLEISAYKSLTEILEKRLAEEGMELVSVVSAPFGATDFSTPIIQAKQAKPDVLIISALVSQSLEIVRTMQAQEFRPPFSMGIAAAFSNAEFIAAMPELSQNIGDVSYWYDPTSDEWKTFVDLYKAKYGNEPSTHAAQGYQATLIVLDALERAGTVDGPALRAALEQTSLESHLMPIDGPITFDEKGQTQGVKSPMTQLIDGKAKIVWPLELREVEPVFPDPFATYEIGSN